MNYVEIIARQEELETELQALQAERVSAAQLHETLEVGFDVDDLNMRLSLDYVGKENRILRIERDGKEIFLSVEDFNRLGGFLQKYNDAIFSYMSEANKEDKDEEGEEDA